MNKRNLAIAAAIFGVVTLVFYFNYSVSTESIPVEYDLAEEERVVVEPEYKFGFSVNFFAKSR